MAMRSDILAYQATNEAAEAFSSRIGNPYLTIMEGLPVIRPEFGPGTPVVRAVA